MPTLGARQWFSLTALLFFFTPLLAGNALAETVTVEPAEGPAGSLVTVRGTDWPPGELIELSWEFNGSWGDGAYAEADESGAFEWVGFRVPRDAPIGPTYFNASPVPPGAPIGPAYFRTWDTTWQAPFTVTAQTDADPTLPPPPRSHHHRTLPTASQHRTTRLLGWAKTDPVFHSMWLQQRAGKLQP